MATLLDLKNAASELSSEEQAGLITHLLAGFQNAPLGPDNEEIDRREFEMDSGLAIALSHDEFLAEIGRK